MATLAATEWNRIMGCLQVFEVLRKHTSQSKTLTHNNAAAGI